MAKLAQVFNEAGYFPANFAVEYSQDGRVVVASSAAVTVYSVCSKPHSSKLSVAVPTARILPEAKQNLCFDRTLPLQAMARDNDVNAVDIYCDLVTISLTAEHEAVTGFRRALWSPPCMDPTGSCLLATLSIDRRLYIYQLGDSGPTPQLVTSIGDLWTQYKQRRTDSWPLCDHIHSCDDVKNMAYALAIIEMVWTDIVTNEDGSVYCHLLTVTRSGEVGCWCVQDQTVTSTVCDTEAAAADTDRVTLVGCFKVDDPHDRVMSLCWLSSGFLLVGRYSGRIHGYHLQLNQLNVFVSSQFCLYDQADNIPVKWMVCAKDDDLLEDDQDDSSRMPSMGSFVAAKGFIIIAVTYQLEFGDVRTQGKGDGVTEERWLSVHYTGFARLTGGEITGLSRCVPPPSGCLCNNSPQSSHYMIATVFNHLHTLCVSRADANIGISVSYGDKADGERLTDSANYACNGVTVSPHGAIVCLVERVTSYFDHLALRDPIRVTFIVMTEPLTSQINSMLVSQQPLHKLFDVLEAIRVSMLEEGTSCCSDNDWDDGQVVVDDLSARWRQCLLFLTIVSSMVTTESGQELNNKDNMFALVERLRFALLQYQMKHVLQIWGDSSSDTSAAGATIKSLAGVTSTLNPSNMAEAKEKIIKVMPACAVCGESVCEWNTLQVKCGSGHVLPVCCLTLLTCSTVPYRRCKCCRAFAVNTASLPDGLNLGSRCTFCDGPLLL